MNRISIDYKKFLLSDLSKYKFAIIDPPWSYDDRHGTLNNNQICYDRWDNNEGLRLIFDKLRVDYLFIWVTNSMIEEIFSVNHGIFKYKTLITWSKRTKNGKQFYGLGNHFRNSTEHLAYFNSKNSKPLRSSKRNIIEAKVGDRTIKPKEFERDLILELTDRTGQRGFYLFSGYELDLFSNLEIDCIDLF
jgi:N6-adenosine-specific RNA methylase IME4